MYLCGYEWLYGTCFGRFWGFMAVCEAVAMAQVLPLGRAARVQSQCPRGHAAAAGGQDYLDFEGKI